MKDGDVLHSARLKRFAQLLSRSRTGKVPGERVWQAFADAFPHRPCGPGERKMLLAALEALDEQAIIRLPSPRGRRWDRSVSPAVPTSVDLVRTRAEEKAKGWRRFPWHPSLHWVSDLKSPSRKQIEFLDRVHEGLVAGSFAEPAPLKYRSLQLTGDEKRLGSLVRTSLFAPGRLTVQALGCLAETTPLAWEAVGDGDRLLIFENAGPFAVARRVLQRMPAPPYGLVAYGGGRSIVASLAYLRTIERRVRAIEYVGDLDAAGLDIARSAKQQATLLGVPEVLPATELLRSMLHAASTFGYPLGWRARARRPSASHARELVATLPADLQSQVQRILVSGRRIPEEVLGPTELERAFGGGSEGELGSVRLGSDGA